MLTRFIKLKVFPNSKKNDIMKTGEDSFKIFVKSKAERGLANKKVLELLADKLNENPKKLKIIKGANTRNKLVKIL